RNDQTRTENCEDGLAHCSSPFSRFVGEANAPRVPALSPHNDGACGLLRARASRSGEQIFWSKKISAKYSAVIRPGCVDFPAAIRFNRGKRPSRAKPMKKFLLALLLTASPAWAQTSLVPKDATK